MAKVIKSGPKKITVLYPLPNTTKQPEKTDDEKKKQRVAAYCRVSSSSDEQILSFNTQIKYYEEYIKENPDYEFVGIYADQGISGTGIQKRDAFKQLMEDCREGLIDMIITKSVSRFGRNTVESLNSIRELKTHGVDVYFEKENIHTMRSEGELLLTLISAVAENESYNLSQNIKWGKRRKYEKGDVRTIPWKNITGYDTNSDGEPIIVEEQAAVIRRIYKEFLDGYGVCRIAAHLNDDNVPLTNGGKAWNASNILLILNNEKYAGNIIFQKSHVANYLTKRRIENKGQLPKYFCENSHPAIIDRETWECARLELLRQRLFCKEHFIEKNCYHVDNEAFPLTGKILCGNCGYRMKIREKGNKFYTCRGYRKQPKPGSCCNPTRVTPDYVETVFILAWNRLIEARDTFIKKWEHTIEVGDELERYRAKELIRLTDEVGCISSFSKELMLKTLNHIKISDSSIKVVFLAGTTLVSYNNIYRVSDDDLVDF